MTLLHLPPSSSLYLSSLLSAPLSSSIIFSPALFCFVFPNVCSVLPFFSSTLLCSLRPLSSFLSSLIISFSFPFLLFSSLLSPPLQFYLPFLSSLPISLFFLILFSHIRSFSFLSSYFISFLFSPSSLFVRSPLLWIAVFMLLLSSSRLNCFPNLYIRYPVFPFFLLSTVLLSSHRCPLSFLSVLH